MSKEGRSEQFVFDLTVYDKATYTAILKVKKFRMSMFDDTVAAVKRKTGEGDDS